ncbi:MAG TPA: ATP-binding cassette domain-containing protein, partial [Roseiflexaceae bacterium]
MDLTDAPGAREMPPIVGRVEFDHVSFSYGDRPLSMVSSQLKDVSDNGRRTTDKGQPAPSDMVLRDVSLSAEPGETIAIVGPTGAGKTTLVNLIGRFYDVGDGAVLIDGIDVRDVSRASLRRQMGVVLQDSFLFSGTI